jgi:hypothetical protein
MGAKKKSRHRVPVEIVMRITAEITPEYQRQVDRSTEKLEREYIQAQKRLEAAERRALKVGPEPHAKKRRSTADTREKRLIDLWAEVELRRQELMDIERLMHGSHVPQRNRGRGSFKPVGIYPNRSLI